MMMLEILAVLQLADTAELMQTDNSQRTPDSL
jgi:hypothetical protein